MKKFSYFLICVLAVMFSGCATTQKPMVKPYASRALESWESDFISTDFEIVYRKKYIRPEILALVNDKPNVAIANPNEACDFGYVKHKNVSSRQLIAAGESDRLAFVYYYQGGGFLTSTHLMIAQLKDKQILCSTDYLMPFFGFDDDFDLHVLRWHLMIRSDKTMSTCEGS